MDQKKFILSITVKVKTLIKKEKLIHLSALPLIRIPNKQKSAKRSSAPECLSPSLEFSIIILRTTGRIKKQNNEILQQALREEISLPLFVILLAFFQTMPKEVFVTKLIIIHHEVLSGSDGLKNNCNCPKVLPKFKKKSKNILRGQAPLKMSKVSESLKSCSLKNYKGVELGGMQSPSPPLDF